MAYYNIRKVLKHTREAKGLDQIKLSGEICTQATLSGYETAKHNVRSTTYKKLMGDMKRTPERQYTVCVDKDGGLLEDRLAMERAFKRYDYQEAEKYLLRMKERADDNELTQQYIARAEAKIAYRLKQITAEEKLKRVDEALRMTVPEYDAYLDAGKVFPFVEEELFALMSLGETYRNVGNYEKALQVDKWIIRCIDTDYIGIPESITISLLVRENMSKIYENQGKHEIALEIIEECLKTAKETDCGHRMAPLLASKAYNYIQLVKNELWTEEKLDDAKHLLRQAYYVAIARGDKVVMQKIIDYYIRCFGDWCLE